MSILISKFCRPKHLLLFHVKCSDLCMRRSMGIFDRKDFRPVITWKSSIITGVFAVGSAYYLNDLVKEKAKRDAVQRKKLLGRSRIGGPFELIDHDGKLRRSEEFKGTWLMIYFGFTHCPDVCPDEIEKMVQTVNVINKNVHVPNIQPIFITVDPVRDTPEIVGKYVKEFSPMFVGLTGSPEQVDKVCKAYRVYYSAGPPDEDDDYIVDHTIIIYLVNPDGDFVDFYGQTRSAEEIASGIELQMLKFEKMKQEENKGSSLISLLKNDSAVEVYK